ncbi:MAG TPA: metallophosphoesterase [Clostridia bacterium]|nr:metallophosphoesterase [Clostridia bacterium]
MDPHANTVIREQVPGARISPPTATQGWMLPGHTPIPVIQSAPPTDTPAPTPFSIVWLSDTQSMTYCNYTDALESMGRWIVDEKDERNILYVVQTGDAVENGFSDWQWKNFDVCYDQFKDELPYIAIAGNHETGMKRHSYVGYLSRRNVS